MNYYIGSIPFDANYLEHHGILGMKWGQRNGPPYPLDAQDHSAAEKKAGWRKSLGRDESKIERYENRKRKNTLRRDKDLRSNKEARNKVEGYKLSRFDKKIDKLEKDKRSFDPLVGKGWTYTTRKGETRYGLTPEDIDTFIANYDKMIKELQDKKDFKKFDFEAGTKYVQKGISRYYDTKNKYFDVKIEAIKNPEFKKSAEYRDAVKAYIDVVLGDAFYGRAATQLIYAGDESAKNYDREKAEYLKSRS